VDGASKLSSSTGEPMFRSIFLIAAGLLCIERALRSGGRAEVWALTSLPFFMTALWLWLSTQYDVP
jgi:hypothetical protein